MKKITVVIGHRGGGQLLGIFNDTKKIKELQARVKEFREEGYVTFEQVEMNEAIEKRFGLYFK